MFLECFPKTEVIVIIIVYERVIVIYFVVIVPGTCLSTAININRDP